MKRISLKNVKNIKNVLKVSTVALTGAMLMGVSGCTMAMMSYSEFVALAKGKVEAQEQVSLPDDIRALLIDRRLEKFNKDSVLDLSLIKLTSEQVQSLCRWLSTKPNIKKLDLYSCSIGDSEARDIVNALIGNDSIKILCLSMNNISYNGVEQLFNWLPSSSLEDVDLSCNKDIVLDDEEARYLAGVLKNKNLKLKKCDLTSCTLSKEGVKTLREAQKANPDVLINLGRRPF